MIVADAVTTSPVSFPILEVKAKIPTSPQYVSHISGKSPGPSGQDRKARGLMFPEVTIKQ